MFLAAQAAWNARRKIFVKLARQGQASLMVFALATMVTSLTLLHQCASVVAQRVQHVKTTPLVKLVHQATNLVKLSAISAQKTNILLLHLTRASNVDSIVLSAKMDQINAKRAQKVVYSIQMEPAHAKLEVTLTCQ